MSFTFSLNNSHSPQQALYELKEALKTAGWTVLGSGDGNGGGGFSVVGDILTGWSTSAVVPYAVTNNRAWWRLRSPDGTRELLWQHEYWNTATDGISIAYSRAAGFTGTGDGAVAADVAPTSTDAFLFAGDRRPSLSMTGGSFSGGVAISKVDYIIGDVTEDYSFACFLRDGTGAIKGGVIYDRLYNPVDAGDSDPTVVAMIGNYSNFFGYTCIDHRAFWTWGDAGVSGSPTITQSNGGPQKHPAVNAPRVDMGQKCALTSLCNWSNNPVLNPGGANPYTSNVDVIEPVYWYSAALSGYTPAGSAYQQGMIHGESRFIKSRSTNAGLNNMDTNGDPLSNAATRVAQAAGFWLIWEPSTTPVL